MENWVDVDNVDIEKFAKMLVKKCQEEVKWERRKLEWIRGEQKENIKSEAA